MTASFSAKKDDLPSPRSKKCAKVWNAIAVATDLTKEGSREMNALAAFLKCEAKEVKPRCSAPVKALDSCHASVLGAGTFQGRSHCASEIADLLACVAAASPS